MKSKKKDKKYQFLLIQANWPWGCDTIYGEKLKDVKKKHKTDDCMLFRIKDGGIKRCRWNGQ